MKYQRIGVVTILKDGGRLLNVSSTAGRLNKHSTALQKRFRNEKDVEDVNKLMEDFKATAAAGNEKEQGWISAAYATSKAGLTAATEAIAEKQKASGSKILVNSCCPGWVKTDMPQGNGIKDPDDGARTPVMLAIANIGERDFSEVTKNIWNNEGIIGPFLDLHKFWV